jgi:hypothetical protein
MCELFEEGMQVTGFSGIWAFYKLKLAMKF